ncbi:MAG: hypothetical protein K2X90_01225 [Candidatus Babeliaceae bacterium]|nr:hypothetical protein [Candidatus Babeliaceae bacterium]
MKKIILAFICVTSGAILALASSSVYAYAPSNNPKIKNQEPTAPTWQQVYYTSEAFMGVPQATD